MDNQVAALGIILKYKPKHVKEYDKYLKYWIDNLPIVHDV